MMCHRTLGSLALAGPEGVDRLLKSANGRREDHTRSGATPTDAEVQATACDQFAETQGAPKLSRCRLTYGRSAAGPLAGWLGAPGSMPNSTMDRLEGAVAGQLQCLVRWLVAWRALLPDLACYTSNVKLIGAGSTWNESQNLRFSHKKKPHHGDGPIAALRAT